MPTDNLMFNSFCVLGETVSRGQACTRHLGNCRFKGLSTYKSIKPTHGQHKRAVCVPIFFHTITEHPSSSPRRRRSVTLACLRRRALERQTTRMILRSSHRSKRRPAFTISIGLIATSKKTTTQLQALLPAHAPQIAPLLHDFQPPPPLLLCNALPVILTRCCGWSRRT